ncbi:GNAT family N-acetyltransferase, partial [Acinetobacter baumannii]|uniref:GNAT family N-acetyltransferase n=1 Tax=Acinetobacter baumannii TaxID=470 RepID=UPI000AFEB7CC
ANRTVGDVELFISASIQRRMVQNGTDYTIRYNGAILGVIALHYIDWVNHRTSIGYWMSEDAQGRGIMTAAVHRLIAHAFDELG